MAGDDELRDDLAVVARRLLGHMRDGDRLRLLEISKSGTLRVPVDVRRDTGYGWADLSLTWRRRTRMFRLPWLRAR